MSCVSKTLVKVSQERQERLQNEKETEVAEWQFGFSKQCGTREAIFCLTILTKKYIYKLKQYLCMFYRLQYICWQGKIWKRRRDWLIDWLVHRLTEW